MQSENLLGGFQLVRYSADESCKQALQYLEPIRVKLDTLSRMKSLDEHIFRIQLGECVHALASIEKLLASHCVIMQTSTADEPRTAPPLRGSGCASAHNH